jgi:hypothetical protein
MIRPHVFVVLALSTSLSVGVAFPAQAASKLMKKKGFAAPNKKSGGATWYQERKGDEVLNYIKITAKDGDGSGKRCVEVWIDYATKPHRHYNPGMVLNCRGGTKTVSRFFATDYHGIRGLQLVVCDVPKTSGPIVRNSKNCRGNLSGIYLRSGKKYSQFRVSALRFPSGVKVEKV